MGVARIDRQSRRSLCGVQAGDARSRLAGGEERRISNRLCRWRRESLGCLGQRTDRAESRRDRGWQRDDHARPAAGDEDDTDRHGERQQRGGQRVCRKPGEAWGQHHRDYHSGGRDTRKADRDSARGCTRCTARCHRVERRQSEPSRVLGRRPERLRRVGPRCAARCREHAGAIRRRQRADCPAAIAGRRGSRRPDLPKRARGAARAAAGHTAAGGVWVARTRGHGWTSQLRS